jgi:26S proteasome regulatory subunit N7
MPAENMEEQGLEKNPNLDLAQWKFLLTTAEHKNNKELKAKLLDAIEADSKYTFL